MSFLLTDVAGNLAFGSLGILCFGIRALSRHVTTLPTVVALYRTDRLIRTSRNQMAWLLAVSAHYLLLLLTILGKVTRLSALVALHCRVIIVLFDFSAEQIVWQVRPSLDSYGLECGTN